MKEDIHTLQVQVRHPRRLKKWSEILYMEWNKLSVCQSPGKAIFGKMQVAAKQFHSGVI